MKRFTIIFSVLLVVLFIGMVGYVALSEEFVEPETDIEQSDEDEGIWKMSYNEVVDTLEETGLIDVSTQEALAESGICSKAMSYNGAELYYWDLDHLEKNTDEYKAYKCLQEEGYIDIFGSGNIISPVPNGPYALLLTNYEGNAEKLKSEFLKIGK